MVVNLERSKDRWAVMQSELQRFGVAYERVEAVDGYALSPEEMESIVPPLNSLAKIDFAGCLFPGEVGCFLSHRKCWKRLVDSAENWGLILEDDIELSDHAREYITSEDWIPAGVDLVQLHLLPLKGGPCVKIRRNYIELRTGRRLVQQVKPGSLGTQGYFISKNAAAKALALSERLPAPVDDFLFQLEMPFQKQVSVWRLLPAVIQERVECKSTIQEGRSKKRKKCFCIKINPVGVYHRFLRRHGFIFNTDSVMLSYE